MCMYSRPNMEGKFLSKKWGAKRENNNKKVPSPFPPFPLSRPWHLFMPTKGKRRRERETIMGSGGKGRRSIDNRIWPKKFFFLLLCCSSGAKGERGRVPFWSSGQRHRGRSWNHQFRNNCLKMSVYYNVDGLLEWNVAAVWIVGQSHTVRATQHIPRVHLTDVVTVAKRTREGILSKEQREREATKTFPLFDCCPLHCRLINGHSMGHYSVVGLNVIELFSNPCS